MIKIKNKTLSGNINAVQSKSMAHRYIICSALSKEYTKIYLKDISQDVKATIDAIKNLGTDVDIRDDYIIIRESNIKNNIFDCKQSGTTLRFMLPIATSLLDECSFIGYGRLPKRPINDIVNIMKKSSCIFSNDTLPFNIKNKFSFSNVDIVGDVSSQYISGLLLASVLQEKDVQINVKGKFESKPYVDMTVDVMKMYGIDILENKNSYFIKKNQKYKSPSNIIVECDFSNIAFFLVAGAIGKDEIKIKNINFSSLQGDKRILEILEKFGAHIKTTKNEISISCDKLIPQDIDVSDIPDLLPILTVLASASIGESRFYNAKRLRLKESDRIKSSVTMINNLGGEAIEYEDSLVIKGMGKLIGGKVDSFDDHRIAMASMVASTICDNDIILENEQAINKSYPSFFDDFKKLNGEFIYL